MLIPGTLPTQVTYERTYLSGRIAVDAAAGELDKLQVGIRYLGDHTTFT
jgi:hypothetical protein